MKHNSITSRGDLLKLLALNEDQLEEQLELRAALLGFKKEETKQLPSDHVPESSTISPLENKNKNETTKLPPNKDESEFKAPYWVLTAYKPASRGIESPTLAEAPVISEPPVSFEAPALCRPGQMRPLADRLLSTTNRCGIDTTAMCQQVARGTPLTKIIQRQQHGLSREIVILLDRHLNLDSLYRDRHEFFDWVIAHAGSQQTSVYSTDSTPQQSWQDTMGDPGMLPEDLTTSAQLLIIGDLGLHDKHKIRQTRWCEFGHWLADCGKQATVLFPGHSPHSMTGYKIIPWQEGGSPANINSGQIQILLIALAQVWTGNWQLIRALRQCLPGASVAHELLLMQMTDFIDCSGGVILVHKNKRLDLMQQWPSIALPVQQKLANVLIRYSQQFSAERQQLDAGIGASSGRNHWTDLSDTILNPKDTTTTSWLCDIGREMHMELWQHQEIQPLTQAIASAYTERGIKADPVFTRATSGATGERSHPSLTISNRGQPKLTTSADGYVLDLPVPITHPAQLQSKQPDRYDLTVPEGTFSIERAGRPASAVSMEMNNNGKLVATLPDQRTLLWTCPDPLSTNIFEKALTTMPNQHLQARWWDTGNLQYFEQINHQSDGGFDNIEVDEYGIVATLDLGAATMRMRWLPPGEFLMGSPSHEQGRFDNESQHPVTLSRGIWLAETACTQAQWQSVTGSNPSEYKGEDLPVENISWQDIEEQFLRPLNQTRNELKGRLPTEAEWEYACRAGTQSAFSWGNNIDLHSSNYIGTFDFKSEAHKGAKMQTVEAITFAANPWGYYQMHGNVWEWCNDSYSEYPTIPVTDPEGSVEDPVHGLRVLRGGSWSGDGRDLRSAYRSSYEPGIRNDGIGFRLAQVPVSPVKGGARQNDALRSSVAWPEAEPE